MNEIIAGEKDINDKIFWNYFKYQNPLFLAKDLIRTSQAKNEQLVNNVNDGLIDLRNTIIKKEIPENENPNKMVDIVEKITIIKKEIPENENPNKVVDIVEKILDFNEKQKGKGINF